ILASTTRAACPHGQQRGAEKADMDQTAMLASVMSAQAVQPSASHSFRQFSPNSRLLHRGKLLRRIAVLTRPPRRSAKAGIYACAGLGMTSRGRRREVLSERSYGATTVGGSPSAYV